MNIPAGYQWTNGFLQDKQGRIISNFYPEIMDRCIGVDGKVPCYVMRVHVGTEKCVDYTCPRECIEKLDYFKEVSDCCMFGEEIKLSEARRSLNFVIKKQICDIKTEKILVKNLGWNFLRNDSVVYCMGSQVYSTGKRKDIIIDDALANKFSIALNRNEENIFRTCRKFLKMQCAPVTILLLASIVGCFRELFIRAGVVPHFAIYIYGPTGTFKTTIVKYFSRLYGDERKLGGLFGELESSKAALQNVASNIKDALFVVDDIAPCQTKRHTKEKMENAAILIRQATSDADNHKCKGTGVSTTAINCILVFTAEYNLETVSILNRTVAVDMEQFPVNSNVMDLMKQHKDFPVEFKLALIKWAVENLQKVLACIENKFKEYMRDETVTSSRGSLNRLHESFAILHVAWDLLVMFCRDKKYGKMEVEYESVKMIMNKVAEKERIKIKKWEMEENEKDPVRVLLNIISNNEIALADSKTGFQIAEAMEECHFGFFHKNALYLEDTNVVEYMRRFIPDLTKRKFRDALEKEGMLIKDKSNATTKKIDNKRYVVINYELLKKFD